VADKMRTPLAQKEFLEFKQLGNGRPVHSTFYFHLARLIETVSAIEQIKGWLEDPKVTSTEIFSKASRNQAEGVGCTEAPRGILFHHYQTDPNGLLTKVNLLIATGQNNPGMNRAIFEVAKKYVNGRDVKEGALNRVEGAIRCYDPCLSCSTHAIGSMPLIIELVGPDGKVMKEIKRNL
jgi:NAD-reducing hydrogenase large subunit